MKPTLGFPSRIEAIAALRGQHKTERQIARLLGIKPNTVTSIEARARQRARRPLHVDTATYEDLREGAAARCVTPRELAVRLLATIARDDLFAAVLDDGGPS